MKDAVDRSIGSLLTELRYRLEVATSHHITAAELALEANAVRERAWKAKCVLEETIRSLGSGTEIDD